MENAKLSHLLIHSTWALRSASPALLPILSPFTLSPVQFSLSVVSDSLRPHGLQHARPPCPSPTPRACSNPCPSSQWYTIQPSHPLSYPSPAFNLSQDHGLFQWLNSLHQVTKVLVSNTKHILISHIKKAFLNSYLLSLLTLSCSFPLKWVVHLPFYPLIVSSFFDPFQSDFQLQIQWILFSLLMPDLWQTSTMLVLSSSSLIIVFRLSSYIFGFSLTSLAFLSQHPMLVPSLPL